MPGINDPHRFVLFGVSYHENTPLFGHSYCQESRLIKTGMVRVGKRRRKRIFEHRLSFVEIDLMLFEVGCGFLWIPFDIHNISIRRYARPV